MTKVRGAARLKVQIWEIKPNDPLFLCFELPAVRPVLRGRHSRQALVFSFWMLPRCIAAESLNLMVLVVIGRCVLSIYTMCNDTL